MVDSALLPHVGQPQLPVRLGGYTLVELLALGGMAEVYLAKQQGPEGFSRMLVIKRLRPHLVQDERFTQMFEREAKLAADLQHPNIVRIDDLGEDHGIRFIAMEYVDGLTLQRLAQRFWRNGKSIPMQLAVVAIADAALGLHYAHSFLNSDGSPRLLVHRDISPDNLIIDRNGVTKVLDFGVAKAAGSVSVTRAGEVKGKVPYMAPEQLHGRPLDGRSDLYSLGATLYWLLTGRRPFSADTDVEMMHKIAQDEPVSPRELNPEIPAPLEAIILRLLAKEPSARFSSGDELAEALQAFEPLSRRELSALVEEALLLDQGEDGGPISTDSFLAATPRTAQSVSTWRQPAQHAEQDFDEKTLAQLSADATDLFIDIPVHEESERPFVLAPPALGLSAGVLPAIAAGCVAALVLGVAGFLLLRPPPQSALELPPPAEVTQPPLAQWEFGEATPTLPVEPEVVEAPAPEAAVVAALVDATAPVRRQADSTAPSRNAPATTQVEAIGPAHVNWFVGRRQVGAGNAKLVLAVGTSAVAALDTRRGVRTDVPVKGQTVRYEDAPTGMLDVRAFPFAAVSAGSDTLGTTPFPPRQLPAGTYKLSLEHEGVKKTVTVEVVPGATAKVKVNMLD
jgi:eukaryotic-like serine/threonine-protein kinase